MDPVSAALHQILRRIFVATLKQGFGFGIPQLHVLIVGDRYRSRSQHEPGKHVGKHIGLRHVPQHGQQQQQPQRRSSEQSTASDGCGNRKIRKSSRRPSEVCSQQQWDCGSAREIWMLSNTLNYCIPMRVVANIIWMVGINSILFNINSFLNDSFVLKSRLIDS